MTINDIPSARRVGRALRAGGPDVLETHVEALRALRPGETLVRVEAVGLNHVESLVRSGNYRIAFPFPYDVGVEGAGVVIAAGDGVSMTPGTRVCWTAVLGCCGTFVIAPTPLLCVLPAELTFEAGASLAHAGLTAGGLVRHCPLVEGSIAAVWGAAGAVGRVLVALLADRGVRVIGIASGARVEAVRDAGAAHVVDRSTEDVAAAVRHITGDRGVSAVFDPIGLATYRTSLQMLAPRGTLVNYGELSGPLAAIDLGDLMDAGSVFVTKYGPKAGVVGLEQIAPLIAEALAAASMRPLATPVAGRFPLSRLSDAYRMLDSNPAGKVLVLPSLGEK